VPHRTRNGRHHAVSALRDALAEVRVAELDEVATKTSAVRDPYAALSWYGARLSDLAASLCAAEATPT
jgi:hypothetical protein